MKKTLLLAAALALAVTPSVAATDVTIPVGDWLQGLAGFLNTIAIPLIGIIVAWLARKVPAAYVTTQNRAAVEQLLEKAIQFALNKAILLAPDKITVPISNDIIANATQYAVDQAPKVVAWAGGSAAIEDKILARLKLTPAADVVAPVSPPAT